MFSDSSLDSDSDSDSHKASDSLSYSVADAKTESVSDYVWARYSDTISDSLLFVDRQFKGFDNRGFGWV